MPTTLTLKNIPDAIYAQLKAAAEVHRRSLNSQAIVCLEAALQASASPVSQRLARARALRNELSGVFSAADIDTLKTDGRP